MTGLRVLIALAALTFPVGPATAQEFPSCTSESWGVVACIGGKSCECTYRRESAMTGAPAGFRWDCGISRPRCDLPPADLAAPRTDLPDSVTLEGDTTVTTTSESNATATSN